MLLGIWYETEVAVKKLKAKPGSEILESVISESKIMSKLKHINIVRFIG